MGKLRGLHAPFLLVALLVTATCIPENQDGERSTCEPVGKAEGWIGGGNDGWNHGSGTSPGNDFRSFDNPVDVCALPCGDVLVADFNNHRICRWTAEGDPVGWIGFGPDGIEGWQQGDGAKAGTVLRAFRHPKGVGADIAGNIYVADRDNHRVVKWTEDGKPVGWIGGGREGWQTGPGAYHGSTPGHFDSPGGVHVDLNGAIYVADTGNHRISRWTPAGKAVGWIGGGTQRWQEGRGASEGSEEGWFCFPEGVTVDGLGNLYVADYGNHRISRWAFFGSPDGWIGGGETGWRSGPGAEPERYATSFCRPTGICLDEDGRLLIAEHMNLRVSMWDRKGLSLGYIGSGIDGWQTGRTWLSASSAEKKFDNPFGVAQSGPYIYVADGSNHRISRWLR